jgi:aspartyl protease family protein
MRQIMLCAGFLLAVGGYFASSIDRTPSQVSQAPAALAVAATPQVPAGGRTVVIPRDQRGHFQVEGRIEGKRLDFMVDTGASVIALTAGDARKLGLRPQQREFTTEVKTANGTVRAAPTQLDRVEIEGLSVRNVAALIMPDGVLDQNLLGLSFLAKLRRFEYSGGKLVLEQ